MAKFKQCVLKKGNVQTTSWIPDKYAKQGKYVKLKENGKWDDGWKVMEVGEMAKEEEDVINRSQDYKKTRKASDI